MTIYVRPAGRGNWSETRLPIDSAHLPPMVVRVGDRFVLGGVQFRVTRVEP